MAEILITVKGKRSIEEKQMNSSLNIHLYSCF